MHDLLGFADVLRGTGAGFGWGDVDTRHPMGSTVFTVMVAWAQMELQIKRDRAADSVATRRAVGRALGRQHPTFTDSQSRAAVQLIEAGEPATQVAHNLGMSRAALYRRIRELSQPTI